MPSRSTTNALAAAVTPTALPAKRPHVGRRAVVPLAVLFVMLILGISRVRDPWSILAIFAAFHLLGITAAVFSGMHAWRALGSTRLAPRLGILLAGAAMAGAITLSAASLLPDLVDLAQDDPTWPRSHVHVTPGGEAIIVTGPLRWSVTNAVRDAVEANPNARVIHLDSPGGRITVGLELHEVIRARGLDTLVTAGCASACTDAFLAGRRRWAGPQARLGFHQGGTSAGGAHAIDSNMARVYAESGIVPAFLDRVLAVAAGTIWFPSLAELRAANVVTDLAAPGRYPLPLR